MSVHSGINAFWSAFGRVAARQWLMVALSGIVTFLTCIGIDLIRGHDPLPQIHDESAYLLAADTFTHGRLTNPPHELWRSFETFHVLQQPTYQAKYPPGQGLFMSAGSLLWDRPILGVWISAALFTSALCWMLQAYFPPRWAVIGTLVGTVTMMFSGSPLIGGVVGYWTQSYWGGAAAALGGALVLGGLRRVIDLPHWPSATALAVGACLLAITRPFEGLLVVAAAGIVLAGWLVTSRRAGVMTKLRHVLVPGVCVMALGLGWLGYYNNRVTGDPLRLPYIEYRDQYEMTPLWSWEAVRPEPPGLNPDMQRFAHLDYGADGVTQPGRRAKDIYRITAFEAGPILAPLLLLGLAWTGRQRWVAFAGAAWTFVYAGTWLARYFEVHYHAPASVLTVILAVAVLRRVSVIRKGRRGLWLAVSFVLVLGTLGNAVREWVRFAHAPERLVEHWAASRKEVEDTLTQAGGRHVVFVRYGPQHGLDVELVYNAASIDDSKIVWARVLSPEQVDQVMRYYPTRTKWLFAMDSDQRPATVTRIPDLPSAAPAGDAGGP